MTYLLFFLLIMLRLVAPFYMDDAALHWTTWQFLFTIVMWEIAKYIAPNFVSTEIGVYIFAFVLCFFILFNTRYSTLNTLYMSFQAIAHPEMTGSCERIGPLPQSEIWEEHLFFLKHFFFVVGSWEISKPLMTLLKIK